MSNKRVPIYFYYLSFKLAEFDGHKVKDKKEIMLKEFNDVLHFINNLPIKEKTHDYTNSEKVAWIEQIDFVNDNEYDIVFNSAKYNSVREVIDTYTFQEKGKIKNPSDGDKEKTHISISFLNSDTPLACIHESNFYGLNFSQIVAYFREMTLKYEIKNVINNRLVIDHEIMPCDEFIKELEKMRTISLAQITVEQKVLNSTGFEKIGNRDTTKKSFDVIFKRFDKKRGTSLEREDMVDFYTETQKSDSGIIRVRVSGINESGPFTLDTEAMKKKQYISVDLTTDTKEVESMSFFEQTSIIIDELR